jgi:hypothetical protein
MTVSAAESVEPLGPVAELAVPISHVLVLEHRGEDGVRIDRSTMDDGTSRPASSHWCECA